MFVKQYLGSVRTAEEQLAEAFKIVSERHSQEFEVRENCSKFAEWSVGHIKAMQPLIDHYGAELPNEGPEQLRSSLFHGMRAGGIGLLHDLQDLSLLVNSTRTQWTILKQASSFLKDAQMQKIAEEFGDHLDRQDAWLCTKIKHMAPETLVVPPDLPSEARASIPKVPTAAAIPDQMWAPLAGGVLTLLVGLVSILLGKPFLFPSLGPTAYLQAENPAHPSTRFFNVIIGHFIGIVAGFIGVIVFDAVNDPVTLVDKTLTGARAGAAVVAIILTILICLLLKVTHPPAAATTLLVALGSIKTTADYINLIVGILLIAILGEVVRRYRIGSLQRGGIKPNVPANAGR